MIVHSPLTPFRGNRTMDAAWFAGRLRELREQKGLTQDQLATLAGVKRDAVARWESGRREPSWSNVVALCRVLHVRADAFLEKPRTAYLPRPGRPAKGKPAARPPRKRAGEPA